MNKEMNKPREENIGCGECENWNKGQCPYRKAVSASIAMMGIGDLEIIDTQKKNIQGLIDSMERDRMRGTILKQWREIEKLQDYLRHKNLVDEYLIYQESK